MTTYEIKHEIGIKGTPEAIFRALVEPKLLAQWWTSDTRGQSEVGGMLEFWFGEYPQKMRVKALEANELVRWQGAEGMDEWEGTEFEFRLEPEAEQCLVHFTQSGWTKNTGMYAHCSTKWAVFLLSLKDLIEKGEGRPHPRDWQINHN